MCRTKCFSGKRAGIALLVVWLLSVVFAFGYCGRRGSVVLMQGCLQFGGELVGTTPHFLFHYPGGDSDSNAIVWWPDVWQGGVWFVIPLWIPYALVAITVYAVWRSKRKHVAEDGHEYCKRCDYDLTGNASGRCPECGCVTDVDLKKTCRQRLVPGAMITLARAC